MDQEHRVVKTERQPCLLSFLSVVIKEQKNSAKNPTGNFLPSAVGCQPLAVRARYRPTHIRATVK